MSVINYNMPSVKPLQDLPVYKIVFERLTTNCIKCIICYTVVNKKSHLVGEPLK